MKSTAKRHEPGISRVEIVRVNASHPPVFGIMLCVDAGVRRPGGEGNMIVMRDLLAGALTYCLQAHLEGVHVVDVPGKVGGVHVILLETRSLELGVAAVGRQ